MSAPAAVLTGQTQAAAVPLRLLHAWHLLSLDAPTVAACWLLLFAQSMHVPHALPAAAALAGAVWLVYAADRLLDAQREPVSVPAWPNGPQSALSQMYVEHARTFLLLVVPVAAVTASLLFVLPRPLSEAWVSLVVPMGLYGAAVHVLHLPARWKAVCVGIFFAVAVTLPAIVHHGLRWPLAAAAVAFGGVCRVNCAVLRAPRRRLRIALAGSCAVAVLPLGVGETRAVATACLCALLLLGVLVQQRERVCARLGWLAWRALVDAALVAPALAAMAGVVFVR